MPMVAFKQVGVYIQGNADATVSELLLNVLHIRTLLNEKAREGMPDREISHVATQPSLAGC